MTQPSKNDKPKADQPGKPGNKPGPQNTQPGGSRGWMGLVVVMLLVATMAMFLSNAQAGREITYKQFEQYYTTDQIVPDSVELKDTAIVAKLIQTEVADTPEIVRVSLNGIGGEAISQQLLELTDGRVRMRPQPGWINFI